jgi:serine/threonine-protein kinase
MKQKLKKLNILFVDDEKQILTSLKAMFKKQYGVFTATSGLEALDIIHKHSIQIIVSDQRMPTDMSGIELLEEIKEISPNTVRLLLTSYADLGALVESVNTGDIFRFVEKPWSNEQIKKTIEAATLEQAGKTPVTHIQHLGLLVVSDDIEIYTTVHHFFGHQLNIYCVNQLEKALNILEQHDIAVLIMETMVQGEKMSVLIQVLKESYPLTLSIVLSTQADTHLIVSLVSEGKIFRYLPKPVDKQLLEFNINAALKRYAESRPELLATTQPDEETSKEKPVTNKLKSLQKRLSDFWHH